MAPVWEDERTTTLSRSFPRIGGGLGDFLTRFIPLDSLLVPDHPTNQSRPAKERTHLNFRGGDSWTLVAATAFLFL